MRTSAALLAGALIAGAIGLGMLAQPRDHRRAPDGIVVVPGLAPPPAAPVARAMMPAPEPESAPLVAPAARAEPAATAAPYPYWDTDDPGVWATPADFSDPD